MSYLLQKRVPSKLEEGTPTLWEVKDLDWPITGRWWPTLQRWVLALTCTAVLHLVTDLKITSRGCKI